MPSLSTLEETKGRAMVYCLPAAWPDGNVEAHGEEGSGQPSLKCSTGFPASGTHTPSHTCTHKPLLYTCNETEKKTEPWVHRNLYVQIRASRATHTFIHTTVPGSVVDERLGFVFGEVVGFELFDGGDPRPVLFCRCA